MPYTKVPEAALVVGQEYVLTHVGCQPVTGQEAVHEQRRVPVYPGAGVTVNRVVERCARLEVQPTSKQALENAFKTWKRLNPDAPYGRFGFRVGKVNHGVAENEYRKRAFYAGRNRHGGHIFTQERSFGSKKPVAFVPINPAETRTRQYYSNESRAMVNQVESVYPFGLDLSPAGTWIAWTISPEEEAVLRPENNVVPPAHAVANARAASNARLALRGQPPELRGAPSPLRRGSVQAEAQAPPVQAEGNLLGLNNRPFGLNNKHAMRNGNANTKKARNAWLKAKNQEAELAPLFGGAKTRRNRRY